MTLYQFDRIPELANSISFWYNSSFYLGTSNELCWYIFLFMFTPPLPLSVSAPPLPSSLCLHFFNTCVIGTCQVIPINKYILSGYPPFPLVLPFQIETPCNC
jgi:hypothetical protein